MAADREIEGAVEIGVAGFECEVEDGESFSRLVTFDEGVGLAMGGVCFEAIAVDHDGVGVEFLWISGPAEADFRRNPGVAGIEVVCEELDGGGVFVLAGCVAFGAGDEKNGAGCGGCGSKQADEGKERFHGFEETFRAVLMFRQMENEVSGSEG